MQQLQIRFHWHKKADALCVVPRKKALKKQKSSHVFVLECPVAGTQRERLKRACNFWLEGELARDVKAPADFYERMRDICNLYASCFYSHHQKSGAPQIRPVLLVEARRLGCYDCRQKNICFCV
jgi:hypothetical protein